MLDKSIVREIIADFHDRKPPAYTRRMVDLACPENKIRCLTGEWLNGEKVPRTSEVRGTFSAGSHIILAIRQMIF